MDTIEKQDKRLSELMEQLRQSEEALERIKNEIKEKDSKIIILSMDLTEFELLEDVFASAVSFVRNNKKQREDYGRLFQNLYLQKHGQTNKTIIYASNV